MACTTTKSPTAPLSISGWPWSWRSDPLAHAIGLEHFHRAGRLFKMKGAHGPLKWRYGNMMPNDENLFELKGYPIFRQPYLQFLPFSVYLPCHCVLFVLLLVASIVDFIIIVGLVGSPSSLSNHHRIKRWIITIWRSGIVVSNIRDFNQSKKACDQKKVYALCIRWVMNKNQQNILCIFWWFGRASIVTTIGLGWYVTRGPCRYEQDSDVEDCHLIPQWCCMPAMCFELPAVCTHVGSHMYMHDHVCMLCYVLCVFS